jgi:hypothetical protein
VNPLVACVLSLTIVVSVSAQENAKDDEYLRWPRQQAETVGKSTYHDGKVGSRLYPWDTRVLKTERSQNYKLRATWFTPEVIRASARWAQLQSHLTDKETEAVVSEAEAAGDTVIMVEIDPNEGSGVIPLDWEAFLQPKGKTSRDQGVLFSTSLCAMVALTNVTSCGVALSTCTATGRPSRSAIAMIFVPLPRFVFPTQFPSFLAGAKVPSMNASCTSR